jgi:hypothetical protein
MDQSPGGRVFELKTEKTKSDTEVFNGDMVTENEVQCLENLMRKEEKEGGEGVGGETRGQRGEKYL